MFSAIFGFAFGFERLQRLSFSLQVQRLSVVSVLVHAHLVIAARQASTACCRRAAGGRPDLLRSCAQNHQHRVTLGVTRPLPSAHRKWGRSSVPFLMGSQEGRGRLDTKHGDVACSDEILNDLLDPQQPCHTPHFFTRLFGAIWTVLIPRSIDSDLQQGLSSKQLRPYIFDNFSTA